MNGQVPEWSAQRIEETYGGELGRERRFCISEWLILNGFTFKKETDIS